MGVFRDYFYAEAAGHYVEIVVRMAPWCSAEYVLLVDGMLGDLARVSTYGMFLLVFGLRDLVLRAGRAAVSGEAPRPGSSAVTIRDQVASQALSRYRGALRPEIPEDEPFDIMAEILQGAFGTNVRLVVNGMPCVMQHLA
jgi:hypothetical protein